MLNSYEDYQDAISTEKITLAVIEPAIRLMGFYLAGGSIYSLSNFDVSVIVSIKDLGVQLTSVGSFGALVSGSFFNDRDNKTLYVWVVGGGQPNAKFLVCTFKQFYSNVPISLPNDFASGTDVDFLPYVKSTSDFGVELDNKSQLGFAIEGSGSINFINEQAYWKPIFDKWTWENKRVKIYSYARALPAGEAKLIFSGFIQKKTWAPLQVGFSIKDVITELKNEFILDNIEDYPGAVVNDSLKLAKQRKVYGYVYGHVPTPIDMVVNGFDGTGTLDVDFGSVTVVGTGTSFLSELSPGDEILVDEFSEFYSVDLVQSDNQFTITEPWGFATRFNKSFQIKPTDPKRYKNRTFLVASHATKEPVATVVNSWSLNYLELSNTSELRVGDKIKVGSEYVIIRRISGNFIKLRTNLVDLPDIGETITRPSLGDVYIDSDTLSEDDYTYDANTAVLTLSGLAEFNVAPVQSLIGTNITFTNASRAVTGVGTKFSSQLNSGDWIRPFDQAEYFEILQVIDDENLELRTPSTYSYTDDGVFKAPKYYKEGSSVLSCDLIGKTKNGLKTGVFIGTAAEIVEDVLTDSGLGAYINSASFAAAKIMAPQLVSMVIPRRMSDKTTQKIRDVIGDISESVFGSLIQTNDFELAFNILSPQRSLTDKRFSEKDLLDFSIDSDSSKLIKTAIVNYLYKEYDYLSLNSTNLNTSFTPDENNYLQQSVLVTTFDSKLVTEAEAKILAERFALVLQLSRSTVSFKTKLQGSRLSANQRIWLSHEKLYERIGTSLNQKISAVESIHKSGSNSSVEIDDLSGTFSRCATITENSASDFDSATDDELMVFGFITDNYGMIDNDSATFGINIIW